MISDLSALNAQSDKPQRAAKVQTTFLQKLLERFLNHDLRKMFPTTFFIYVRTNLLGTFWESCQFLTCGFSI